MVWDEEYCETSLAYACDEIRKSTNDSLNVKVSCYNDCKCPNHQPFWNRTSEEYAVLFAKSYANKICNCIDVLIYVILQIYVKPLEVTNYQKYA